MRLRSALCAAVVTLSCCASAVSASGAVSAVGETAAARAAVPADNHVRRAPVSPRVSAALGPTGELRGMALNDVGTARLVPSVVADLPRLAATGITSVTLYTYLYVQNPGGSKVSAGQYTPSDAEIEAVASAARLQGLDVHLMPVLLDFDTYSWRGGYIPKNVDAFFASYTTHVMRYARLAQRVGATMFYVGSENDNLVNRGEHWRKLIERVRAEYDGAVSYLSTPYRAEQVTFWRWLDLAAISPYFSLGGDDNPSYARMRAAWREVHTPFVRRLAARLPVPLVFGEVGYHSQQGAFEHPARKPDTEMLPAPAAQGDAYRALLDALQSNPSVYGVTWFRWAGAGGPLDTSYSPREKPAECAYTARWAPDPTIRSAAGPTQCDLHALDRLLATIGEPLQR